MDLDHVPRMESVILPAFEIHLAYDTQRSVGPGRLWVNTERRSPAPGRAFEAQRGLRPHGCGAMATKNLARRSRNQRSRHGPRDEAGRTEVSQRRS